MILFPPPKPAIIQPAPKELICPRPKEGIALLPGFRTALPRALYNVIIQRGLDVSLVLSLDAGDINCTTGSANQVWSDRSSGGNNYNRGAGSGSGADDPTFNGTPGALTLNEYWLCNGSQFFTPVAATTFDDTWNKAGALVTVCAIVWIPTTPTNTFRTIMGNYNGTNNSATLDIISTNVLSWRVEGGSTTNLGWSGSVPGIAGKWAIIIVSVNEAGGAVASHWNVNGTITTFNGAYTSPAGTTSAGGMTIGRDANGGATVPNTWRYGCMAAWNRALSQTETASLFTGMRKRYGL